MLPLYLIFSVIAISEACTPFSMENVGLGGTSPNVDQLGSTGLGARARGQSTQLGINPGTNSLTLGTSSSPPVQSPEDLACFEFDTRCRWRNMEGLFIDELDWFQGSGHLDQGRLQIATGTPIFPDGQYAIVATDTVQLPTSKAVLVADQITCQQGPGQLHFFYWTSPDVRLKVCTKLVARPFPEFNFCSASIETGDPGPAIVSIPAQNNPFQLYIIADNFVFRAANLQGGFAIVDNIEYEAEFCEPYSGKDDIEVFPKTTRSINFMNLVQEERQEEEQPKTFMRVNSKLTRSRTSTDSVPSPSSSHDSDIFRTRSLTLGVSSNTGSQLDGGLVAMNRGEDQFSNSRRREMSSTGSLDLQEMNKVKALGDATVDGVALAACEALTCSFKPSQPCSMFATQSNWSVSSKPVGNPLTGIKGDASKSPYNREGSFGYVAGPIDFSRLITAPFYLDRNSYIVFSYHRVERISTFRVLARKTGTSEEILVFEAPRITKDSRRWFRENRLLPKGHYDYLAFEVQHLTHNAYIGVDEWMIVDEHRRAYCTY